MRNGINDYEKSTKEFAATLSLALTAPAAGTFCEILGTISLNKWSKVHKCCVAHFNG